MLDLDKNEVSKMFTYPNDDGTTDEWYKLKFIPFADFKGFNFDKVKLFQAGVLDWGGVSLGGDELECNLKNKETFLNKKKATVDRLNFVIDTIQTESMFTLSLEDYMMRLGKLLVISENGKNNSPIHISPTAEGVEK